ncbi:MAG: hypothetical protein KatS3mg053_0210 [Candidatus Roseilinea sp.]|nr:MAG: hypothetical protein KatS3mg053_0210 [Candidatus Roseilinea sp.]
MRLIEQLDAQERLLERAVAQLRQPDDRLPSYAAEWLLDNLYVVQGAIRQVREDMPRGFYRKLIKLPNYPGELRGIPRIYAIAQEFISSERARLDPVDIERASRFMQLYQDVQRPGDAPLTMAELWALPVMLRLSVLEYLAQAVAKITDLPFTPLPISPPLPAGAPDEEIVANCIISLRALATVDWQRFFEGISRVERALCEDPTGVYPRMDKETRDHYRKVIERLAEVVKKPEVEVAHEAVALARAAQAEDGSARRRHVGYYLLDRGKAQLEARLGYRPSLRARAGAWLRAHPTLVYLGAIGALTAILSLVVAAYAHAAGADAGYVIAAVLITLIPASAIAVSVVDWTVTLLLPPAFLPKLDFSQGIPDDCRTLVVIPALLTSAKEARSLLQQLELHYLRNPERNLYFALLTDFADAKQPHEPGDDELIEQVAAGIHALNARYGNAQRPFLLLHRARRWNPREQVYMGWERKRGKLHELNRLLRALPEEARALSFTKLIGDLDALRGVRYVITLDADTVLPRDGAQRLIATLAHPLNVAEFDPHTGRVRAGYTIVQPRVEVMPMSANRSLFTRIYAGDVGLDLYTRAVSNVYQDLFGAGIYVGKGIYDVDAFERSLAGRVPENTLLSHDLFEGIHGRVALATDIVMLEDYPPNYLVHIRRSRRWIRGDWQLLPWLLPRVPCAADSSGKPCWRQNDLPAIDRWKIFDNLRRSLLAPALLALLIAGWLWLPGSPLVWTALATFTLAPPLLLGLAAGAVRAVKARSLHHVSSPLFTGLLRWLLALAFLPYETVLTLGSVIVTLVRVVFTRRHLLQWVTAAQAVEQFGQQMTLGTTLSKMLPALVVSGGLVVAILAARPAALPIALPFLAAWAASPYIAYAISKPIRYAPEPLSESQRVMLQRLARRTWLFFERFVGPDSHWLPPDNFQESPRGIAMTHTSPTNIGLMLVSTLAAHDFGYIGPRELTSRLRLTFETLEQLERYRGHFLNWYDTRTLQALPPRYVSTVDSGNLAACLRILAQGCRELVETSAMRRERWRGLLDTLGLLDEVVSELGESGAGEPGKALRSLQTALKQTRNLIRTIENRPARWMAALEDLADVHLHTLAQAATALVESRAQSADAETLHRLRLALDRLHNHCEQMRRDVEELLPWLPAFEQAPQLFLEGRGGFRPTNHHHAALMANVMREWRSLRSALPIAPKLVELRDLYAIGQARLADLQRALSELPSSDDVREAQDWCASLVEAIQAAVTHAQALIAECQWLEATCERYFQEMQFGFLYDPRRELFHIGYNLTAGRLDDNYYDLLASESRIASVVAIAKGDAPIRHWLYLGRPLAQVNGSPVLMSWSATMFEYLMPLLFMRSYEGTLLHFSTRGAVERQIAYAKRKGTPWGISESGYYAFDAALNYQYRAFGVPGLGFKRDLGEDLVVAPYASLLALPVRPREVVDNIAHLRRLGALGAYGLYEAIDFTPKRLPLGNKHAIVRSYMAHHQGMIFLSLANYLLENPGGMARRFHADPRMRSIELILQEKAPLDAPIEQPGLETTWPPGMNQPHLVTAPWTMPARTPSPQVHALSNGRYTVVLSNAGGGFSQWRNPDTRQTIDLTRWRADATRDAHGAWIYIQDVTPSKARPSQNGRQEHTEEARPRIWSACAQPMPDEGEGGEMECFAHTAAFRRSICGIASTLDVVVSPDDDVEIRRLSLTNHTDRPRRLRVTSYGEAILAQQAGDARHPAFNKLFIESEYIAGAGALVFRRRPRSQAEAKQPFFLVHAVAPPEGVPLTSIWESDRSRFLDRNAAPGEVPQALRDGSAAARAHDARGPVCTLDPIFSLTQEVVLKPRETVQLAFLTLVAPSRVEALSLVRRYRNWRQIERTFDHARARAELELHRLGIGTPQIERFQRLLSCLLYPNNALRTEPSFIAANRRGQSSLWPFGISGDYPILLVRLHDPEALSLAQEALQAHRYWRNRGLKIDLVFLILQPGDYSQELRGQLQRLITRMDGETWLNQRGGIFIVYADQAGEEGRILLETAARAVLDSSRGSLADQLGGLRGEPDRLPPFVPTGAFKQEPEATPPLIRPSNLRYDNGLGGFTLDGREYVIYLTRGQHTPAPWSNVIANPDFGCLVTESGGGFTWHANSGENRLTPWSNDPLCDPPGEAIYLRDEETAEVWSPTPQPMGDDAPYLIRHGAGYSIFEHHSHRLKQRVQVFVAPDAPVKLVQVRLENTSRRSRRITATFYAEWVLGVRREETQPYIVTEFDHARQALLARNPYSMDFGECVAFAAANKRLHGLTADRAEFLGRMGSVHAPAALKRIGLAGAVGPGLDPCAALQLHLDLAPGGSEEVYFILGQGDDRAEALRWVEHFQNPDNAAAAWRAVQRLWDGILGAVQVRTPDPAMDLMLNRWLLYQALACRIWGRSAFYQSSGAFGFRDQLQDVMALIHVQPQIAREHILRAARHQFPEGDVLHWWHPPASRGLRTRISDNLLWLPFVTAHYVQATGDTSILSEPVPFLAGAPLGDGEEERYSQYNVSDTEATLYEHCKRAIARGITHGAHGLPLMGAGDWNDGMNRVGIHGKGESVWLGWFACAVLRRFAEVCERMGEPEQAEAYRAQLRGLAAAIESHAWDGGWYLRAFYDDGAPLGTSRDVECQIDAIAQSWAVLSGAGRPDRAAQAMAAVRERLVRDRDGLILLFTPPLDKTERDPGYVKGYAPGIRENGGQYTHAALWTVWAFAQLGDGDRAQALFRLLNPIYHADSREKALRYRVEPYVIAADVYGAPPHVGRGGWTWYTGSAGWMYRLGLEAILGIQRCGDALHIRPCISSDWPAYEVTYRFGAATYHICVENPRRVCTGVVKITLDDTVLTGDAIPLRDDGEQHEVRVMMG